MMIIKHTKNCGKIIAGFQCDTCKKTEITGDFPVYWFRDDKEMLCFDCLFDAYTIAKDGIVEYHLGIKRILKELNEMEKENK